MTTSECEWEALEPDRDGDRKRKLRSNLQTIAALTTKVTKTCIAFLETIFVSRVHRDSVFEG